MRIVLVGGPASGEIVHHSDFWEGRYVVPVKTEEWVICHNGALQPKYVGAVYLIRGKFGVYLNEEEE